MAVKNNVIHMKRRAGRARYAADRDYTPVLLKKGAPDMWLLLITVFLVGVGVIMVFSASYYDTLSSDPYEYLKRQGAFAAVGLMITLIAMNANFQKYRFLSKPLLYFTAFLLVAVFFFEDAHHVHRWIPIGPFNIQPSEVAKFTMSMYMANLLGRRNADPNHLGGDLGTIGAMLVILLVLIYKEPDLGAMVALSCIAMAILVTAGMHWLYVGAAAVAGGVPVITPVVGSIDSQAGPLML